MKNEKQKKKQKKETKTQATKQQKLEIGNYNIIYNLHCVKSVQIRSFFWSAFSCIQTEYGDLRPNTGKYGPEKTPYLDNFRAVLKYPVISNFTVLICNYN